MKKLDNPKLLLLLMCLVLTLYGPILVVHADYSSSDESDKMDIISYYQYGNCTRLPPNPIRSPAPSERNVTITGLLNEAYSHLVNPGSHQGVILILGNTGVGKTTLTQIIAGDLRRVHAVLTDAKDLVIVDDDEKISVPAITSRTLVPELVVKTEEDGNSTTAFYDCPGFDDTRGPVQDIAANFFLNEIVRGTNRVKMLFLVSYSHIQATHDRGINFVKLVKHATEFVKAMDKFKSSIGLVVTNVKNHSFNGKYIKDEDIMIEIVYFLKLCKRTFRNDSFREPNQEKKRELEKQIAFLSILLEKNSNGKYSRIGFSRNPIECGPLSGSEEAKDTRERVTNLYKNLEYSAVGDATANFGFTLGLDTIANIGNYSNEINNEVVKSFAALTAQFRNWFERVKFPEAKLVPQMSILAQSTFSIIRDVADNDNSNLTNPVHFQNQFNSAFSKVGFRVASNSEFEKQEKILSFFEAAAGPGVVDRNTIAWIEPIKQLALEMGKYKNWYGFCLDIEQILSTYSFQSRRLQGPQGDSVDWLSFIQTNHVKSTGVVDGSLGNSLEIIGKQKQVLNDVMMYGLSPITLTCNAGALHIVGHFVKLSDFIGENGDLKYERKCDGKEAGGPVIYVYVSNTVFIDASLNGEGKSYSFAIISPKWEVVGRQHLNLNGAHGQNAYPEKAQNGLTTGSGAATNGGDGKPGKPGGLGGRFFGLAWHIVKAASLKITANGGNGGSGQHGGDGGNGGDGRHATKGDAAETNGYQAGVASRSWKVHPGFPGHNGGNGGHGGIGGFGGKAGHVSIFSGDRSAANVKKLITNGSTGKPGIGGVGGIGGKTGNRIHCDTHRVFGFKRKDTCDSEPSWLPDALNGSNGIIDFNRVGVAYPTSHTFSLPVSYLIDHFISLYRQDLHAETVKFVEYLNSNAQHLS